MTGKENHEESWAETEDIYYKSYTIWKKLHTTHWDAPPYTMWTANMDNPYIPIFYTFPSLYHVDMGNSYIPLWVYVLHIKTVD